MVNAARVSIGVEDLTRYSEQVSVYAQPPLCTRFLLGLKSRRGVFDSEESKSKTESNPKFTERSETEASKKKDRMDK